MQIDIADEVFASEKPRKILAFIERAVSRKHLVYPLDWEGEGYVSWLLRCAEDLKEPDVGDLLKFQMQGGGLVVSRRAITIDLEARKDNRRARFSLQDVEDYILQATQIYVENSRADRRFLLSLFSDKKIKNDIEELERIGGVSFAHCGGITELANQVRDDARKFPFLKFRAIAVFDSDATGPGDKNISPNAREAMRACNSVDVKYLCLDRRAIENYIPHACLILYAEHSGQNRNERLRLARTVSRLSRDQQAYLHMKNGLDKISAASPTFSSLSPKELIILSKGFGDQLSTCFSEPGWITWERFKDSGMDGEVSTIAKFVLEYL